MNNVYCPICSRIVSYFRVHPLEPGTLNPYGYSFQCEHCTYTISGQNYLRFLGACYADKEIKYFVLRSPLHDDESVLMMEVLRDRHSIRFFRAGDSYTFLEEKVVLQPPEAYKKLLRIQQLIAFT